MQIKNQSLFENMVIAETAKQYYHRGQRPRLYFYRDRSGNEVDLVIEHGRDLVLFEIKSGQFRSNWHVWPVKDLHQIYDQTVLFFK